MFVVSLEFRYVKAYGIVLRAYKCTVISYGIVITSVTFICSFYLSSIAIVLVFFFTSSISCIIVGLSKINEVNR